MKDSSFLIKWLPDTHRIKLLGRINTPMVRAAMKQWANVDLQEGTSDLSRYVLEIIYDNGYKPYDIILLFCCYA